MHKQTIAICICTTVYDMIMIRCMRIMSDDIDCRLLYFIVLYTLYFIQWYFCNFGDVCYYYYTRHLPYTLYSIVLKYSTLPIILLLHFPKLRNAKTSKRKTEQGLVLVLVLASVASVVSVVSVSVCVRKGQYAPS
jgi:hypothetical protein